MKNVQSDGIGIDFLARHLVTLDFPNHTLYLKRQSIGPRPDPRMTEYKPIPDREPEVTAHLRAVVQELTDGTARADDFTASAWKRLQSKQKDFQTIKKYVGDIVSLTLVKRSSVFRLAAQLPLPDRVHPGDSACALCLPRTEGDRRRRDENRGMEGTA